MKAVSARVIAAADAVWIAAGWERAARGWRRAGEWYPPEHTAGSIPILRQSDMEKPEVRRALEEYGRAFLPEESAHPCDALRRRIEARAEALEERIAAVAAIIACVTVAMAKPKKYGDPHRELVEESRDKLRDEIASLLTDIAGGNIGSAEADGNGS